MARTLGFNEEEARRQAPQPPIDLRRMGDPNAANLPRGAGTGTETGGNPVSINGNPFFSQDNINRMLGNLRFGQAPTPFTAPTLGGFQAATAGTATAGTATAGQVTAPPPIVAPQVTAEQGGFRDFNELERRMFESQYRPIEREIGRQRSLADERLQSELAAAGLADSGTGQQMRQRQNAEYSEQLAAQMSDASNRAAVQRYGMEYTQSMENARLRQEANLANAGFNLTAQIETARNLLTASVTNAQLQTQASIASAQFATQASIANANNQTQAGIANAEIGSRHAIAGAQLQLQAMGLNMQQEQGARRDFLSLLGLQQEDLARMDAFNLENTALFYNTYLRQLAIIIGAGTGSFGKTDGSSSAWGFDESGSFSYMGGGGGSGQKKETDQKPS